VQLCSLLTTSTTILLFACILDLETNERSFKQIKEEHTTTVTDLIDEQLILIIKSCKNLKLHCEAAFNHLSRRYIESNSIVDEMRLELESSRDQYTPNHGDRPVSSSAGVVAMHVRRMKKALFESYKENAEYLKVVVQCTEGWLTIIDSLQHQMTGIEIPLLDRSTAVFQDIEEADSNMWVAARYLLAALVAQNDDLKQQAISISDVGKQNRMLAFDSLNNLLLDFKEKIIKGATILKQINNALLDLESFDRKVTSVS